MKTDAQTPDRLSVAACLAGAGAFLSFWLFNINVYSPLAFPGAGLLSPLFAFAAVLLAGLALRTDLDRPSLIFAWIGLLLGSLGTLFWLTLGYLFVSGAFNF